MELEASSDVELEVSLDLELALSSEVELAVSLDVEFDLLSEFSSSYVVLSSGLVVFFSVFTINLGFS